MDAQDNNNIFQINIFNRTRLDGITIKNTIDTITIQIKFQEKILLKGKNRIDRDLSNIVNIKTTCMVFDNHLDK